MFLLLFIQTWTYSLNQLSLQGLEMIIYQPLHDLPSLFDFYPGWLGEKKKKKLSSVSFGLPHFCFSEPCLTPITKTPLDSTHNQEENLKPQEKSFSQKRNCILHLYMLESAFNFLHGDLFYVLFWFASNPVFYCKKKRAISITGPLIRCAVKCCITAEF